VPNWKGYLDKKYNFSQSYLNLEFAYNPERKQYHFSVIIEKLQVMCPEACERILGRVDVDLYVPYLNFVFGEADAVRKTAIISTKRLRPEPEYYGLPEDEELLWERALKESVHELGHTCGLIHCPDKKCVTRFSNSSKDTDIKSPTFCRSCREKLLVATGLGG
jgi:archaemetzincin